MDPLVRDPLVRPLPGDQWHLVLVSVLLHVLVFALFIAGTQLRGKVPVRASQGAFISFIIALYVEMYGLPLTVYVLSSWLGFSPVAYPPPLALRVGGGVMVFSGFLLVYFGWKAIYHAGDHLVTDGVYRYLRHPQYLGLWLFTLGLLVQWPTLMAAVLWPCVLVLYYRLALAEERDMQARHPLVYPAYARAVPRFFPRIAPATRPPLTGSAPAEPFRRQRPAAGGASAPDR